MASKLQVKILFILILMKNPLKNSVYFSKLLFLGSSSVTCLTKIFFLKMVLLSPFLILCHEKSEIHSSFVTFYQLSEWIETHPLPGHIEIRGFLYKTNSEALILAEEPNLKSCCVSHIKNREKQIIIKGYRDNRENSSLPIRLSGLLSFSEEQENRLVLNNVLAVQEKNQGVRLGLFLFLVVMGLVAIQLSWTFLIRVPRKEEPKR